METRNMVITGAPLASGYGSVASTPVQAIFSAIQRCLWQRYPLTVSRKKVDVGAP